MLPETPGSQEAGGCLPTGLVIGMSLWILLMTAIYLTVTWVWEQQLFEGSLQLPNVRWLILLIYALAVIIPSVIIWLAGKRLPNRAFFAAFGLAGGFALFLVPARLAGITDELVTFALLILGSGLYWILMAVAFPPKPRTKASWQGWMIALLLGGALALPWVLWGALGSAWDTVLSLAAAVLFGITAARILEKVFRRPDSSPARKQVLFPHGLIASLVLLVMVSGLGVNGNQGLLALSVPLLGWGLAALYYRQDHEQDWPLVNRPTLALLVSLAAFWPMAFIDPDEMAAVVSLGQGELIQWANLAAFAGLGIGLLGNILLLAARPRFPLRELKAYTWAVVFIWVGVVGLYLGLGQPGLFGERLFVILKDQADLSNAAAISDYSQRRTSVYQLLVAHANTSQSALRQSFDRFGIRYTPYYLENAIEVEAGPLVRLWLMSRPEVSRVLDNPILRPLPEPVPQSSGGANAPADTPWNIKMIGADRVWNELGATGKGIIVGQSGLGRAGGPSRTRGCLPGTGRPKRLQLVRSLVFHAVTDRYWRPRHAYSGDCIGEEGGCRARRGVDRLRQPGPQSWKPCLVSGLYAVYAGALSQDGDSFNDGRPEMGAQILNNSWGCPPVEGCDANALLQAVSALRAAGIFVVASAGNEGEGGCSTVSDPIALYAQVYSVGAVNSGGELASFSSRGPVEVDGSGRTKPDISAPGEAVLSAFPGGTYSELSGTSMAGPHVAGVVALMWSANPALIGEVDRTQQILDETASPYQGPLPACVSAGKPNNGVGYGVVNAYEAVRTALEK